MVVVGSCLAGHQYEAFGELLLSGCDVCPSVMLVRTVFHLLQREKLEISVILQSHDTFTLFSTTDIFWSPIVTFVVTIVLENTLSVACGQPFLLSVRGLCVAAFGVQVRGGG